MSLILLKYPKKSHRQFVNIPRESKHLAEFIGIIFGDGGIDRWQLVISLNSILDLEYSRYIISLIQSLFQVKPVVRKRPNQNTLVIVCARVSLIDFLINKGAVRGNKILQKIDIPDWINNDPEYKKFFVRGLVDTDGCLFTHKHTINKRLYFNIGLCFTNLSKPLIITVFSILKEFGIKSYISNKETAVYLYSYKSVVKYLNIFGSSNSRIINKYHYWRGVRVAE